jgi:hypothetical protein
MAFNGQPQKSDFGNHWWPVNQLIAAGEGALDGATWGQGDRIYAGVGALIDAAKGKSLKDAYDDRIKYEKARDDYYDQHYGAARTVGEIGGAFVPIPGTGGVGAAVRLLNKTDRLVELGKILAQAEKVGDRIKQVSPLIARERAVVSGAGAAAGVAGQLYSDAMNKRLSSLGSYAGAAAGSALQAQMALHMRPKWAGAGGGAVTSALQDIFNGRPVSALKAAEAAGAGGAAGAIGGVIGRARFYRGASPDWQSIAYTNKDKELMGEAYSKFRTLANLDITASTVKKALPLKKGGYTVPDQVTRLMQYVESKAGISARLRKRQKQAYNQGDLNYRVDHLLPKDVGALLGFLAAQGGYHLPAYFQDPPDQQKKK